MECLLTIAPREQVLSAAALGFICLFLFLRSSCADGGAIFYPARRSSKSSRFAIDCVFFLGKGSVKKHPRFAGLNVEFSDGKTSHLSSENQTKNGEPKVINNGGPVGAKSIAFCRAIMASSTVGTAQQGGEAGCDQQHVGRGGRNPSVRSHKTTKSFGGWLCENLLGLQILGKSQISKSLRNMLESSRSF